MEVLRRQDLDDAWDSDWSCGLLSECVAKGSCLKYWSGVWRVHRVGDGASGDHERLLA